MTAVQNVPAQKRFALSGNALIGLAARLFS